MAKGLLFASFDFSTAHEDEFHDWYDLEHIPERLRVPDFINAERWISEHRATWERRLDRLDDYLEETDPGRPHKKTTSRRTP